MEEKEFLAKLKAAVSGITQYRKYDISRLIVSKVFNGGHGVLNLFKFDIERKKIAINNVLFNKADSRRLDQICEKLGISDWERVECKYDYPDWYNHDFGLKYAINKENDKKAV